ncbi:MAG TPA: hypothetical protein VF658_03600 [Pyrinomonadaceae bacterium]|jgi:hypothetical protein
MKRILAAALFSAIVFLSISSPAAAQTTRTFQLSQGSTVSPASPGVDPSGATTYYGGLVAGQVGGTTPGTFTLSLTFRSTGVVDPVNGVYSGAILSPYSSFVVTQGSGRKSVTTSGTIDSGVLTYRLTSYGMAEIISVTSGNLTVWEGKNKRRTAIGNGTLNYGTSAQGAGTITLFSF